MRTAIRRPEGQAGRAEEPLVGRAAADAGDHAVDHAGLGHEQLEPDDAGDHLGHDVRHEDERPHQTPAAHPAVEQQRDAEAERELDHDAQHDDDEVVAHRLAEHLVVQHPLVVAPSDELVHRAEAPPVVERHPRRREHRPPEEQPHQRQGGRDEDQDLQALADRWCGGPAGDDDGRASPPARCGRSARTGRADGGQAHESSAACCIASTTSWGSGLPGEQQRDLVVHRSADGLAEGGVEVELHVRRLVAHLDQLRERRVADRVDARSGWWAGPCRSRRSPAAPRRSAGTSRGRSRRRTRARTPPRRHRRRARPTGRPRRPRSRGTGTSRSCRRDPCRRR